MHSNQRELIHEKEVYQIVGAAIEVSKTLGCGFLEAVYQEAMQIELENKNIPFEAQKRIKIRYKGQILDKEYIADLVCYNCIIVEIKAVKEITGVEEAQLLNYLAATGQPVGLILNFGAPKLQWKRYANTEKRQQAQINKV